MDVATWIAHRMVFDDTGWSNKTVNCNFFLTGLKITQIGKTQPFLETVHWEVWYFNVSKEPGEEKTSLSGLCQNGGLAQAILYSAWTQHSDTLKTTPQHLKHLQTYLITPKNTILNIPLHFQAVPETLGTRVCLGVSESCLTSVWGLSWSVGRRPAASVGACRCLVISLCVWMGVSVYLGDE